MSYGIQTSRIVNGTTRFSLDPQAVGGRVFLGIINVAYGSSQTFTYANVPGADKLRYYFVNAGPHTVSTSTQAGTGWAQITVTGYSTQRQQFSTILLVFTTATTEPSYGIITTNDAGERTVSAQFPVPALLGRVTMSAQPTYTNYIAEGGGVAYYHSATTSLGSGTDRLILWTLPQNASNIYFTGDSYISSSYSGNATIYGTIFGPAGATYTVGEALIFSLNSIPASTEGYGMQLFNSSGSLLFDASNDHLMIKGFSSITYTGTDTETTNESPDIFTGSEPAILVPNYYRSTAQRRGTTGLSSWVRTYEGAIRRQGTSIYAKRILTEVNLEDAILSWDQTYGSSINTIFGIDAANLGAGGGTSGGTSLSGYIQPSGTEANTCSYDSNTASTCTISQSYFVTPTGGNGNAISYSWSLTSQSHPGTYIISGSSTNSTVTISTTTGDTAGPITAVLQCSMSQSGSSTALATYNLSRVHEGFGELVSITPSTLAWNSTGTISVKGTPGTTFTFQITTTNSQPSTFNGPLNLDQSGNYLNTNSYGSDYGSPAGLKYLWINFAATNNVKVATVTTTPIGPTISYFRVRSPSGGYSTSATGDYASAPIFEWATTSAVSVSITDLSNTGLSGSEVQGSARYTSRTYTLTATHVSGGTSTAQVTYNVSAPTIVVSPSTLPNTKVNNSYNQTLSASGGRAGYSFSVTSGALPGGLSISGSTLSGTPNTQGTFSFTITATDADGYTGSRSYTIVVDAANIIPTISQFEISLFSPESYSSGVSGGYGTTPKFRWNVSNASTVTISATGNVSGTNPASVASSGNGSPVLGSINNYGTTTITLTATSSTGDTASAYVYFYGPSGPTVTLSPGSLNNGYNGYSFSQTISASGGTSPYTFSVISGSLPGGLTLSSSGTISGTPYSNDTSYFTVQAQDAQGYTGSQSYSITISSAPTISISPPSLPNGVSGNYYSENLSASGGSGSYSFSITSGSLPSGLYLSGGTIYGYPNSAGTSSFTVQATDSQGFPGSRSYSITITNPVTYNEQASPNYVYAGQYFNIVITGGMPNTVMSFTGAATGSVTLNSSGSFTFYDQQIFTPGVYTFYLSFAGSGNTRTYTIYVDPAPGGGGIEP